MESKNDYMLSASLVQKLHAKGIFFIEDVKAQSPQVRGRYGWNSSVDLGLKGQDVIEWNPFFQL
jgi:hypothetical protein